MTIREKLRIMDEIRRKNDVSFAEAARRQAQKEMWRTWYESLTCVACGAMVGLLVLLIAG